jgi:GT2 family glycosyltransferase
MNRRSPSPRDATAALTPYGTARLFDLTIVVVSYNDHERLTACLDSLRVAIPADRIEAEVRVIDNHSPDGSAQIVHEWADKHEPLPFAFRVHAESVNHGFAMATNIALRRRRGRHALLLNPDTVVPPGTIRGLLDYLEANPHVGVVGPRLYYPAKPGEEKGKRQSSIHPFPTLLTEAVGMSPLRFFSPKQYPNGRWDFKEPIDVDALIGAVMLVRGDTIASTGLMDPGFFLYLEETDWQRRMSLPARDGKQWRRVFHPGFEAVHVHGASTKKVKPLASTLQHHRSLYRYFRKHLGKKSEYGLMAILLARMGIKALWELVIVVLTLGLLPIARRRLASYAKIGAWHVIGRPRTWTLTPGDHSDGLSDSMIGDPGILGIAVLTRPAPSTDKTKSNDSQRPLP